MTRRWVRQELKKNPAANFVVVIVNYIAKNKNSVIMGFAITGLIGLFIGVVIKNRIKENKEAIRIFVFAQNDFYRFNYKEAIKKFSSIEKNFSSTKIMDQVIYFKGLSYYRQGNLEQAERTLIKSINEYKKSKIISECRLSLAVVYEDLGKNDKAFEQYDKIEENDYLRAEAMAGMARISEMTGKTDKAVDIYTRLQSHYVNTYWGKFADERLIGLGIKPRKIKEYEPEVK